MHGGDIYRNQVDLDFSVNVTPLELPDTVREAMIRGVSEASNYPDPDCLSLREGIAKRFHVESEQVICGNGASELLLAVCRWRKPKRAIVLAPSFSGYERALQTVKCETNVFPLREERGFSLKDDDVEELLGKIRQDNVDMVLLSNPSNPVGTVIPRESLMRILKTCEQTGTTLLLDECFMELTAARDKCTMTGELNQFPTLLILRAFTKSFAIPGIRLGYLLCGKNDIAREIRGELPEWNVSLPAQYAGIAALGEEDFLREAREFIRTEREYLETKLQRLGATVYPSKTNFILFRMENETLYDQMLNQKILIRDCSDYKGLKKGYYRVAVKTRDENLKLLTGLEKALESSRKTQLVKNMEFVLPDEIEKRSFEIIGAELKQRNITLPAAQEDVIKRVIHTSADFDYASTLTFSENAVRIARELIQNGASVVTDTNMAKAGINKKKLASYGGEVYCFMADEDVAREAKERQVTRATVSMERAAALRGPVIFAVGNAPTALISLHELMEKKAFKPDFVIGVPVGFVNVEAAKELILNSDVPYIVNRGRKGGSNVAAAICNALLYGM